MWNGDGRNDNAALTVFRHFDSASVVKGLVGEPPKTAWVIGYALFERIYYLLVAGYDPYGDLNHQLASRLYMDFMRMEGETNFLTLLPRASRGPIRDYWYRGASADVKAYVAGSRSSVEAESAIPYRSGDPQRELYAMLAQRLAPVLGPRFSLDGVSDPVLRAGLQQLADVRGASLAWWPEASVLRIDDEAGAAPQYFSLLRNTASCQRRAPGAREGRTAAGREQPDRRARFHRRLSERDLPRDARRAAGACRSDRRAVVRGRLPPPWRPLRDPSHQPGLLGRERRDDRCLRPLVAARGRAVRLQPAREPLKRVREIRPAMNKAFTREPDGDDEDDDDAPGTPALPQGVRNYLTPAGYRRLRAELLELLDVERPKIVEVVSWAAKNGDRSENGDYLYGKKRLREIDRRIRFLTKRLDIAEVADPSLHHGGDQIFFGATVTYAREDGSTHTITIKGVDEADSLAGEVSWVAPIARALLKARVGDEVQLVTPGGVERLEVLGVAYPAPGAAD